MPRSGDGTRSGLVAAAKQLFHRKGYHQTTLADVAAASEVPLGSVYYHFRTKDALGLAVVESHAEEIRRRFAEWDLLPDPRQRLKLLLAFSAHHKATYARYGCPYGTLAAELAKDASDLVGPAGELLGLYLEWVARQYAAMGAEERAERAAAQFVAALQGACVLAHTLRRPDLLVQQTEELTAAVDAFAAAAVPYPARG